MNDTTRKATISVSLEEVLKTVYAESACLALMNDSERRPAVISSDNRRLLRVYAHNAWLNLACELASVVDYQQFEADDDGESQTLTLTLLIPADASTQVLRHFAEQYVSMSVLADCYAARSETSETFLAGARGALSGLRLDVAGPARHERMCWWV